MLLSVTILMLVILTACPEAHHWLHADADHQEHTCAITLYAQGATTALVGLMLTIVTWRLEGLADVDGTELCLSASHYLHLPGRAPPRVG